MGKLNLTVKTPDVNRKEQSVNIATMTMTNWLYYRQNQFLIQAHELAHQAEDIHEYSKLPTCLSAFEHAMLTLIHEYRESDRKHIRNKLNEARTAVYNFLDILEEKPDSRRTINKKEYRELHRKIMALFDMLYQAQNHVGMGVGKERYKGVKRMLKDAMEA